MLLPLRGQAKLITTLRFVSLKRSLPLFEATPSELRSSSKRYSRKFGVPDFLSHAPAPCYNPGHYENQIFPIYRRKSPSSFLCPIIMGHLRRRRRWRRWWHEQRRRRRFSHAGLHSTVENSQADGRAGDGAGALLVPGFG